jgi:hypothetical protein
MTVNLVLWLLVIAQAVALELAGVAKRHDNWVPLTDYINKYVPKTIIASAIAWIAWHFGVNQ